MTQHDASGDGVTRTDEHPQAGLQAGSPGSNSKLKPAQSSDFLSEGRSDSELVSDYKGRAEPPPPPRLVAPASQQRTSVASLAFTVAWAY